MIAKELPGSEVPETNNGLMIGGLGSLPVVGNGIIIQWGRENCLNGGAKMTLEMC